MQAYSEIQNMIDELTNTTQQERHSHQHREQLACERRLKQMAIKREKEAKRKAMIQAAPTDTE